MENKDVEFIDCGIVVLTDTEENIKKFKLQNKKLLLTYPNYINKKELYEYFIVNIAPLKAYKIANELYKEKDINGDDKYHTHFLLEFDKKPCIKNCNKFDYNGLHPNIRFCDNNHFKNCIAYLDKDDESPYTNITLADTKRYDDKNLQLIELKEKIQSFSDWNDLVNDDFMTQHLRYGLNWVRECWNARIKPKPKSKLKFQQLMLWQKELYKHLKKEPVDREIIWVWSNKPKQGKTTFKCFLNSKLNILNIDYMSRVSLNDIIYLYDNEDIICFDLPWSKSKSLERRLEDAFSEEENSASFPLLDTLENLSNKGQIFTSVKYTGKKSLITSHILVFSNCSPINVMKCLPERLTVIEAKLETLQE